MGTHFPRWVEATVPLLFLLFLIPGVVYGLRVGSIRSSKDAAGFMGATLADLGPYIVLAFFAAQFIAIFKYTHLGEMLALTGGLVGGDGAECFCFALCFRVACVFGEFVDWFDVGEVCVLCTSLCTYVNASWGESRVNAGGIPYW